MLLVIPDTILHQPTALRCRLSRLKAERQMPPPSRRARTLPQRTPLIRIHYITCRVHYVT
eukprot:1020860-Prymnesium_polylepis.1